MAEKSPKSALADVQDVVSEEAPVKRVWYHSTLFNAFVIGGVGMSIFPGRGFGFL